MSAGFAVAKQHTREAEIARVASFLAGDGVPDEDGKEIAGHPRRSGERSREKADGADKLA